MNGTRGGSNAAFFLFFAVAVLGFGGSLQPTLAILRGAGFCAALLFFRRRSKEPAGMPGYTILVGGFVTLSLGHAFSSVYLWVSLQHAINIALAAVLLAWAVPLFRSDPEGTWNRAFLAIGGIAFVQVAVSLYQRFVEGDMRPHGTFDNPNFLSEFLAAAAILFLARSLGKEKEERRIRLAGGAAAGVLLAAALSLSSSRGVLLSLVPALAFLLIWRFGARRGSIVLAVLGVPALALLGWRAAGRFFAPDIYNYGRWIMWKSALRTFLDHPFGVGLGGYKYYWYATQSPVADAFRKYGKFATTAHNEYLEILAGLGILGFVFFVAVLVFPLLQAGKRWGEIPEGRRWVAAGAVACLLLSGSHAAFDFNFHEFGIVYLDVVLLGALLSCLPETGVQGIRLPGWANSLGAFACAVVLLASAATLAGTVLYDLGERQVRRGNPGDAERSFHLAVSVDPLRAPYPDALSALNFRYLQRERSTGKDPGKEMGFLKEAIHWEEKARMLNPREPKYSLRLSSLFLELYRVRREPADAQMALILADSALRIHPFSVETLLHRSRLLLLMGRNAEAVRDLEYAVSVEPNFCRGYAKLAELAGTGNLPEANGWSEKAEQCRKKARNLDLVDYEKWLVESPEK
ncbi:MAG: O-antigen ligase family protein [Candidatus Deferrimicrobiaceae bacterium]